MVTNEKTVKSNPFTLIFGKEPRNYISRPDQVQEIIGKFEDDLPSITTYLITGVRGSGKTVMMSYLYDYFDNKSGWISVDLNPESDILKSFVSKLYSKGRNNHLFLSVGVTASGEGFGISPKKNTPEWDFENQAELLLKEAKKHGKKILITIDEVTNSRELRAFAHSFQSFTRLGLPVYLIMTGLYENIHSFQNNATMTFFYRAPKINLKPLNLSSIRESYIDSLGLNTEVATKLANLTKGYAFAFQLLGYIWYDLGSNTINQELLNRYDHYLEEFVYQKIWDDCSEKDREILLAFNEEKETVSDLMKNAGVSKNTLSVYRDRLIRKGILEGNTHGILSFILPRFFEFIQRKREFESAF